MKNGVRTISFAALLAVAIGVVMIMKKENSEIPAEGYIGKSEIVVENGKMTPEVL